MLVHLECKKATDSPCNMHSAPAHTCQVDLQIMSMHWCILSALTLAEHTLLHALMQGKDLASFLIEITSIIMAKKDPEVGASGNAMPRSGARLCIHVLVAACMVSIPHPSA